jgi:hypothetical protein
MRREFTYTAPEQILDYIPQFLHVGAKARAGSAGRGLRSEVRPEEYRCGLENQGLTVIDPANAPHAFFGHGTGSRQGHRGSCDDAADLPHRNAGAAQKIAHVVGAQRPQQVAGHSVPTGTGCAELPGECHARSSLCVELIRNSVPFSAR